MNIELLLKKSGKSVTEERKQIFSFLETKHIFSAQDIVENFANIGRASVFRTLNLFLEIGIIRRVNIGKKEEFFELIHDNHHHEHMRCESCDRIMSFESSKICKILFDIAKEHEFKIKEHNISLIGRCTQCR